MYLNILESSTKLGIDNRKLTLEEMVSKLQEEVTELKEAIKNKDNIDHISEESWDCFQLSAEVLDKLKEQHNVNLEESLKKHHKKIKERGWKAKKEMYFKITQVSAQDPYKFIPCTSEGICTGKPYRKPD
ncbi:hypothetical protein FDB98_06735 [Clostridium botulinum]|nr:hypothetical protein [Clostridium botulinum]